jgi:hypothetical protein
MKPIKLLFTFFLLLSAGIMAQQKVDLSKERGYFDLMELAYFKNAEPITEINLEEPMLKMIAKMGDKKNEGLGNMIGGLKLVRVNEYSLEPKDFDETENVLESLDKTLQSKEWDRIIRSKHKNNVDNIYVKRDQNGEFAGLIVASMHLFKNEKTEKGTGKVTLVNIVGKIDLNSLGSLSKQFNFPGFDKPKSKED